jgi:hypothetical protein
MTRTKPRVEQAAGLSSWVVGLRAQWVRYNTESVFAAPRPVEESVLSNRIGLESQEWRWSAELTFGAKSVGARWLVFGGGNIIGGLY